MYIVYLSVYPQYTNEIKHIHEESGKQGLIGLKIQKGAYRWKKINFEIFKVDKYKKYQRNEKYYNSRY